MKSLSVFIDKSCNNYCELKRRVINLGNNIIESIKDRNVDVAIYYSYKDFLYSKLNMRNNIKNFLLILEHGIYINQGYEDSFMLSEDSGVGNIIDIISSISEDNDITLDSPINLDEYFKINISREEYQTIVYDWNETDRDYSKDKTIYELFEEQVKQNPNNVALVYEGQELTYKELNQRSNQLARYIRRQYKEVTKQELAPDTLIPLCLERSMDIVIGTLAIMKAGGAYVPMDSEYPQERFRHVTKDTQAKLVITQSHLENKLHYIASDISLISIDSSKEGYIYDQEETTNLKPQSSSTDLAYVIYTSGTTGLPKGVMVEHKSLINLSQYMSNMYEISNIDRILQFAKYTFDMSVEEIFPTLISGARLIISSNEARQDFNKIIKLCRDNKITIMNLPPSFAGLLGDTEEDYTNPLSYIRIVSFGGDSFNLDLVKLWASYNSKIKIFNAYGPTEYTVNSTISEIDCSEKLNIGRPINNTQVYILNQHHQPVPIGVVGELYIGGAGLARGYLNRPELTAERFISNPFATESDIAKGYTRLYKTGDLVRWLEDGNIEYIGRNDDQVKIRGFRIELEEIDTQIRKLESVSNSITTAIKGNLYSYIELNKEASRVYKNSEYDFYIYSLEQRPDLKQKFVETQLKSWPEYFFLDKEEDLLWAELYKRYLKYQLVIVDQDDNVAAVCNCLPIYISDTNPKYPKTWEGIFKLGFNDSKPNSLICMSATVIRKYRSLDLYDRLIENAFKLANQYNLNKVFSSLRPLRKNKYPLDDIKDYCIRKNKNNYYRDVWFKKNQQLGGELKQINERSQYITANIDFWEKCLNMKFPKSGVYTHKDLLNGLTIDLDKGIGGYCEPGVIFEYKFIKTQENDFFRTTSEFVYKSLLLVLPEYMLPSSIRIMHKFPLTANGKLDRKALPALELINEDSYVAPATELEERLCNIFAEVLGLERVGVIDDFFRIGGNSILAIKLSHKLSKELGKRISVADIFRTRNIKKFIFESEALGIIKPFYKSYNNNLPDMLLIHPGIAGCEVYSTLADNLANEFNSIGIDNYNISSKNKISSLNKLSRYYLNQYLEKYSFNNKPIHLLGWSLGGRIALEMASILESKGYDNIKVTLLDSVIPDSQIAEYGSCINLDDYKNKIKKNMLDKYDEIYVNKVINAINVEKELSMTNVSNKLLKSRVTLLKATIPDTSIENISNELNSYILTLKDNNISKAVNSLAIKEVDAHHGNIIEKIEEIVEFL
ncbi:amino acid adenylation domain-containing protein [Francisella sp. 19X1-34]|uniref:non-ribosomal peptide synthetase n=1 Tax=Francisella sp. 19X1-34 TaxID=3087177 RepID=UPI002E34A554|nr:amino acid adenylation domain-containing protein [Francisella sp. 19X1-34]MED7789603.1 amino acid adenylation domain-containing protein [Francisella sp. 19X1-34]